MRRRSRRKETNYKTQVGDLYGGTGRHLGVPARRLVRVHNVTVETIIVGPYCVHAGSVFAPGPYVTEQSTSGPGQVNC